MPRSTPDELTAIPDVHTFILRVQILNVADMSTQTETHPLITGIAQVKLPVTDLPRSVSWYCEVLDLRHWIEFVEEGEVCGAGLIDRSGAFNIALRLRQRCAGHPVLTGFDVVAFTPSSRFALDVLAGRCSRLGVTHSGIADGPEGSRLDIPDPDGTVLRFYHFTAPTTGFTTVEATPEGMVASTV